MKGSSKLEATINVIKMPTNSVFRAKFSPVKALLIHKCLFSKVQAMTFPIQHGL